MTTWLLRVHLQPEPAGNLHDALDVIYSVLDLFLYPVVPEIVPAMNESLVDVVIQRKFTN